MTSSSSMRCSRAASTSAGTPSAAPARPSPSGVRAARKRSRSSGRASARGPRAAAPPRRPAACCRRRAKPRRSGPAAASAAARAPTAAPGRRPPGSAGPRPSPLAHGERVRDLGRVVLPGVLHPQLEVALRPVDAAGAVHRPLPARDAAASELPSALRSSKSAPLRSMYATTHTGSSPARSSSGVTCGSAPVRGGPPYGGRARRGSSTTRPPHANSARPCGSVAWRNSSTASRTARQVASSAPCSASSRATAAAVSSRS